MTTEGPRKMSKIRLNMARDASILSPCDASSS